jgi:hypothetical protein
LRDTVTSVAPTLLPGTVLGLPVPCAMLLPEARLLTSRHRSSSLRRRIGPLLLRARSLLLALLLRAWLLRAWLLRACLLRAWLLLAWLLLAWLLLPLPLLSLGRLLLLLGPRFLLLLFLLVLLFVIFLLLLLLRLSLLFLLPLIGVGGSNGSEKKKQGCCANSCEASHKFCLGLCEFARPALRKSDAVLVSGCCLRQTTYESFRRFFGQANFTHPPTWMRESD